MDSKLTIAVAVFAAAAWAQDADPTIRSNTRLVDVEVVVRSKGKPVTDLKAEDFAVFDQGKPQPVAAFAIRRATTEPPRYTLDPGEVSNRLSRAGEEVPGISVILLDTLNSDPEDLVEMRRQLLIYLDGISAKGSGSPDRIALYSLNKTLQVVQEFTDDTDRLRRIVNRWKSQSSVDVNAASLVTDLPTTGDPITDGMVDAAAKEMTDNANLRRAETTAFALELIAKHLSGLPGRKKLIWAGASFTARTSDQRSRVGKTQIEIRDYSEYITKSVRALNEAQVAVYPIDPRNPWKADLFATGRETMNLFAGGTGGKAFYSISDIASAIEQAVNDSEVTYSLGFYPDSSKLDGKYHSLNVKLNRKDLDNVELRFRKGYLAGDNAAPKPVERQKSLKEAMESPLDATGISLSGYLIDSKLARGGHELVLRIDARELEMATEQTKTGIMVWTSLITIATSLPSHPKPNGTSNDIKLTFTEARLKEVLRDGYRIKLLVENNGFPGSVRVAVADRTSGKIGTLTLNIP